LSTVNRQEEITHRVAEVEVELESFANLYVASFQLHSSLRVRSVVRNVRELMEQLVGVRSLAIYFADAAQRHLAPISSHGVDLSSLPAISLHDPAKDAATAVIEHAYLTGISHIAEGDVMTSPAACIPMQIEDRTVGVIAIYTLLEQKKRFVTVDRELFKLVGAHVGGALVAAYLFGQSGGVGDAGDNAAPRTSRGRLPSSDELRDACA
ncbi:MAG: GAF domain-containing protein, partial [Polyangiaceae bacterium]